MCIFMMSMLIFQTVKLLVNIFFFFFLKETFYRGAVKYSQF